MSTMREFGPTEFGPQRYSLKISDPKPITALSGPDTKFLVAIMLALVAATITAGLITVGLATAYVAGA